MENKIQQVDVEKMLKQLKANTIVMMTTSWHSALRSSNSANIKKFIGTKKIIGYGLLVASQKPIVLYRAEMNFKAGATTFTELACYKWTTFASPIIDASISYILKQLE